MPKAQPFVTVDLANAEAVSKRFAHAPEELYGAMNRALRDCGRLLVPPMKEETPKGATHNLANKTVFQVLGHSDDQRMEIRQSAASKKGFMYGVAVRTGTKPHFPPIDALVPWVIKVLHVGADRARSVAFLVARKISRVGTKANPYHERVVDANKDAVIRILEKGVVQFTHKVGDVPYNG